ncbi:glycosyltransferase family 69 protein [Hyaloscypha variabilis F]|uniref:Glycosyltransferase family 69 protein n=1 Tax=Hyaloscypha variabilis (strain UAMH 11265 / GT02V1 / F) TaxID=1149755 RepID=A0A2J6RTC4_HYAVF|nr:glycosyltransferase family 69 protein [Hyaloscypha variabilis F]
MLRRLFPRSLRRILLRPKPLLITLLLLFTLDAYFLTRPHPLPQRTKLPPSLQNDRILIASMARNSEYMLRLYWNGALLKLVKYLGPENVYVSILESGSQEDTKGALRDLEMQLNKLGVENRIILGMDATEQVEMLKHVPEEGERDGWIFTARGETGWELRRIPYLADLRNRVMEPLLEFEKKGYDRFDRVLWINDVVFTLEDATTLLSTRDGDYAAACSLDFSSNPEKYYDTFALRDIKGHKTATLTYPYFSHSPSISLLSQLSPIPVSSCWNGMIAFSAAPFYPPPPSAHRKINIATQSPKILANQPLKFRGIPDSLAKSHLEGSECCLIHADNPLTEEKGVWVNPNVRVAYNATTYAAVNHGVEVKADVGDFVDGVKGGDGRPWPSKGERFWGVWGNRVQRWTGWVREWSEGRVVRKRVGKWARQEVGRKEDGVECLVNEMQVMFDNGWQHV